MRFVLIYLYKLVLVYCTSYIGFWSYNIINLCFFYEILIKIKIQFD